MLNKSQLEELKSLGQAEDAILLDKNIPSRNALHAIDAINARRQQIKISPEVTR